eukprot:54099-Amphidinium_carterae.1
MQHDDDPKKESHQAQREEPPSAKTEQQLCAVCNGDKQEHIFCGEPYGTHHTEQARGREANFEGEDPQSTSMRIEVGTHALQRCPTPSLFRTMMSAGPVRDNRISCHPEFPRSSQEEIFNIPR